MSCFGRCYYISTGLIFEYLILINHPKWWFLLLFNRLWFFGYRFGDGGNPELAPGDSSRDPDKKSRSVGGHIYNLLKGHLTTPKKQNCQAHPCVCMFLFVWHRKKGTTIRWFSPQWICKLPRHEKKTMRRLAFEYTEGKGLSVYMFLEIQDEWIQTMQYPKMIDSFNIMCFFQHHWYFVNAFSVTKNQEAFVLFWTSWRELLLLEVQTGMVFLEENPEEWAEETDSDNQLTFQRGEDPPCSIRHTSTQSGSHFPGKISRKFIKMKPFDQKKQCVHKNLSHGSSEMWSSISFCGRNGSVRKELPLLSKAVGNWKDHQLVSS